MTKISSTFQFLLYTSMKTRFKYILISLLLFGCQEKERVLQSEFNQFLKELDKNKLLIEAKIVFIIPNAGCTGCIMDSEQYMFDKIDSLKNTFFVLTSFNSVKELRAKYFNVDRTLLKRSNVILDINQAFAKLTIDKRYPLVLFLNEGSVNEVIQFDSGSEQLLTKIASTQ